MLFCLSSSHKNASLSVLEALNIRNQTAFVDALRAEGQIEECLLLQTCHRVELYFCIPHCKDKDKASKDVQKIWSITNNVSFDIITKFTKIYLEKDVIEHIFLLVAGLESVVIGEDQILGQVRNAFQIFKDHGSIGLTLERLFSKSINVGKLVRTKTKINEGSVSISFAAVDVAFNTLGDLSTKKVLIIGAGEAGTLAAEALKCHSVSDMVISNRTYSKSLILAKKVDGVAYPFERVFSAVSESDLVISAVSVEEPLLTKDILAPFFIDSKGIRHKLMLDISQPRSIDPTVALLPGVEIKTIDDINQIISSNLESRVLESEKAKEIINEELIRFQLELSKLVAQPLIDEICRTFENIRQKEFLRALRKMGNLDEQKQIVLERFSRELIERIAQLPIKQLKKAAIDGDNEFIYSVKKLFQIDESQVYLAQKNSSANRPTLFPILNSYQKRNNNP
jgi:glutamyl-tRNA reductase